MAKMRKIKIVAVCLAIGAVALAAATLCGVSYARWQGNSDASLALSTGSWVPQTGIGLVVDEGSARQQEDEEDFDIGWYYQFTVNVSEAGTKTKIYKDGVMLAANEHRDFTDDYGNVCVIVDGGEFYFARPGVYHITFADGILTNVADPDQKADDKKD